MMSVHRRAPNMAQFDHMVLVGSSENHLHLVHPESTCLKKVETVWVGFGTTINYGLCRMPKGHDGPCCDEVRTCDGCDTTYPDDGNMEWSGNEDVQFCSVCTNRHR